MRIIPFILFMLMITSCASSKQPFQKERTCSNESLKYLKNPRNKEKVILRNPDLIKDMARTSGPIQKCYEDFSKRSGNDEFNTCLVVGVDRAGELEFYNFGSREVSLDQKFLHCAKTVTRNIPFSKYGQNYILIQSYRFYVTGL